MRTSHEIKKMTFSLEYELAQENPSVIRIWCLRRKTWSCRRTYLTWPGLKVGMASLFVSKFLYFLNIFADFIDFYWFIFNAHQTPHLVALVSYNESLLKIMVTIENTCIVLTMYIYDSRYVELSIIISFYLICFKSLRT